MPNTDPSLSPEEIARMQAAAQPAAQVQAPGLAAASALEAPGGYTQYPGGAALTNVPQNRPMLPNSQGPYSGLTPTQPTTVVPLPSEQVMPGDNNPLHSPSPNYYDQVAREKEYADRLREAMAGKPRPAPAPAPKAPLTKEEMEKALAMGYKR